MSYIPVARPLHANQARGARAADGTRPDAIQTSQLTSIEVSWR
jgi:hypothetical protein